MLDNDKQAVPDLIVDRLRCPRCGAPMTDGAAEVVCDGGHRFAKRDGFVDFSAVVERVGSTERTLASFGFEWNAFDEVRDEDQNFAEIYFRDLDLDGLADKVGLDAGCGKGRFTRILADHLDRTNVTVVQADLRDAPFAPESFDFISSLGVLHHLDDPLEGFTRLVRLLAPKGQMLLYLYSRPPQAGVRSAALAAATAVRKVTVRLPHRTLKTLSTPIAAVLSAAFVLPGRWGQRRGIPALADLPIDTYRDKPFRSLVLDTFDRLSAPVEYRYVWKELAPWFADAGLEVDAARDETGWFILAHRP